ncbi:MAG: ferredoxin--NADP(+) reductase [Spirochaetia bacterium]|nr:ferredoxin--NADP(+) reductase [Spirochaetia bacterium]
MKIEKEALASGKTYKPSEPFSTKVLAVENITNAEDEVKHLVIDLKGSDLQYREGQSIGVLPPGNQAGGKPQKLRLYSVASARNGDPGFPGTASLCVKRLIETKEDGSKYLGIASNYLCDLRAGDPVLVTGPVGMHFLLPRDDSANLIFVATGTGIAPFKAFLDHIFRERTEPWRGKIILIFGAKFKSELLYCNDLNGELQALADKGKCQLISAVSREQKNPDGSRVYVQHRIEEHFNEIAGLMEAGNFCFYICGLKGMEKGIEDVFRSHLGAEEWDKRKLEYKKDGKWIVEVY